MPSCSVYGCENNSNTTNSVDYHPFPTNAYRQQWLNACGWQSIPVNPEIDYICSTHFQEKCYTIEVQMVNYTPCLSKTLKSDAVPTLRLPQTHIILKDDPIDLEYLQNIVVYTIGNGEEDNADPSTSSRENANVKQLIQFQTSSEVKQSIQIQPSSTSKIEVHVENIVENEYSHIKSYPDLYVLQADNKSLKRKITAMEEELVNLEQILKKKESKYRKLDAECKKVKTQVANETILTLQEQKALFSKVFSESQIKLLTGKKKVAWSDDDMAVGYTIRHLSNKRCYTYLTKTLNIPLPAVSSIKRWVSATHPKKSKGGIKNDEEKTDSTL